VRNEAEHDPLGVMQHVWLGIIGAGMAVLVAALLAAGRNGLLF